LARTNLLSRTRSLIGRANGSVGLKAHPHKAQGFTPVFQRKSPQPRIRGGCHRSAPRPPATAGSTACRDVIGSPSIRPREKCEFDTRTFSGHHIRAEDLHMNPSSLFAARAIVADMPPPPHYHSHRRDSAEAWVYLLIICAICAAASAGLWRLFRRRSKDSVPEPTGSREEMKRQATVPEDHHALKDGSIPECQTELPGRNGEVTKSV